MGCFDPTGEAEEIEMAMRKVRERYALAREIAEYIKKYHTEDSYEEINIPEDK